MPDDRDKKQLIKSAVEHKADQSMVRMAREKRALAKRAGDLEATAASAIKKGDKKLAASVAKLASKTGDSDLMSKLVKMARKAKTGLKAVPIIGSVIGIGTALQSGNASAALPAGFDAPDLGPAAGSAEWKLENGIQPSPEEMQAFDAKMKGIKDKQAREISRAQALKQVRQTGGF